MARFPERGGPPDRMLKGRLDVARRTKSRVLPEKKICQSVNKLYGCDSQHLGKVLSGTRGKAARRREAREADRSLLPYATGTKVVAMVITRALIRFFEQRASAEADAEIDRFAIALLKESQSLAPHLFGDYQIVRTPEGREFATTPYRKV